MDASLTVLNWPVPPEEELVSAIAGLATAGPVDDCPMVLQDGDNAYLAWRGSRPDGVLGMYRMLDPLLAGHGLSAIYASPALEVFVPPSGEVMALGPLRHVRRDEWESWVRGCERDEQLASRLWNGLPSLPDLERRWADARREARGLLDDARGGEHKVDFGLLAGCQLTIKEWYDADGMFGEASASFRGSRHRTDFLAPASEGVPGEELEESLTWRVTQWDRIAPTPKPADVLDDDGWRLRAWSPIDAKSVKRLLPRQLGDWVTRATGNGASTARWLSNLTPGFAPLAQSLQEQLKELEA